MNNYKNSLIAGKNAINNTINYGPKTIKYNYKNSLIAAKNAIYNTINYGIQTIKNIQTPEDIELLSQTKSGGAFISDIDASESPGDALGYFLKNCQVQFIGPNSAAGRIAILTLNDGVPSPYTRYSAESLINPQVGNIRSIILKFSLVKGEHMAPGTRRPLPKLPAKIDCPDGRDHLEEGSPQRKITLMQWQHFRDEAIRQQLIACQTANDDPCGRYEMATPYVLYTSTGDKAPEATEQQRQYGINLANPSEGVDKQLAELLLDESHGMRHWPDFVSIAHDGIEQEGVSERRRVNVGVIAMTYINRDETVRRPPPPPILPNDLDVPQSITDVQIYMVPVIYELIRVAVWSSILHLDLNPGNYFVVPAARRLVADDRFTTRAILIDWGTVHPLAQKGGAHDAFLRAWNADDMEFLFNEIEAMVNDDKIKKKSGGATMRLIHETLYGPPLSPGRMGQPALVHPAYKVQFIQFLNKYHILCKQTSEANERMVNRVWRGSPPNLLSALEYFEERGRILTARLQTIAGEGGVPNMPTHDDYGGPVEQPEPEIGGRKKKTKKSFRGRRGASAGRGHLKTRKSRGKKRHPKQRKTRRT